MRDRLKKTWSTRIRKGSLFWRIRSFFWRIRFVDGLIQNKNEPKGHEKK